MDRLKKKEERLLDLLQTMEHAAVMFSGGTDSTLLTAAAVRALGDEAVAVTIVSPTLPQWERSDAEQYAASMGIRHFSVLLSELGEPLFVRNDRDRCYHCKALRLRTLAAWASHGGYPWLLDGSNLDDLSDERPGMRALAEVPGIRSPLLEAEFTKADVRSLSREWNLPSWKKPAGACLASRIPYGIPITAENLSQVEGAEEFIRSLCGADSQIRVRHHGDIARIEVDPDLIPLLASKDMSGKIAEALQSLGFPYVALDLRGYRMGGYNRAPSSCS